MGINGNDVLRGFIDPPEVAAILRKIHSLDSERAKLYGEAGEEYEPNDTRRRRLEDISEKISGLWAAVRRERFRFTERAA